jgi:hypothetical protein
MRVEVLVVGVGKGVGDASSKVVGHHAPVAGTGVFYRDRIIPFRM